MTGHEKRDDELVDRYHQAGALDPRRPADRVGVAVRAHARMVATSASSSDRTGEPADRPAANVAIWKRAMVASVAVFGLAGLLLLQWDRGPSQERDLAMGPAVPMQPAPSSVASRSDPVAPAPPVADVRTDGSPQAESALAKAAQSSAGQRAQPSAARPAALAVAPVTQPSLAVTDNRAVPADASAAAPANGPAQARQADAVAGIAELSRPLAGMAPAMPQESTMRSQTAAPPAMSPEPASAAGAKPGAALLKAAPADTPLHALARTGRVASLAQVLGAGVPIDARDASGRTALMLAAMAGHAEMVQRLLAAGAQPALRDHDQLTAAQLARARGFEAIARTIEVGS